MPAMSLIELMFVLGVTATLCAASAPGLLAGLTEIRAQSAARHVAGRLQDARVRAITRGHDTAIRFARLGTTYRLTVFEDGNNNGILSADIAEGVDVVVVPSERLSDSFPGVEFGSLPGLPGAEGSPPPGTDPIRFGVADGVTFTPTGTATSGSAYLRSGNSQFVIRVYGETGRVRILRFNTGSGAWMPL